jgi:hypothetical protein
VCVRERERQVSPAALKRELYLMIYDMLAMLFSFNFNLSLLGGVFTSTCLAVLGLT